MVVWVLGTRPTSGASFMKEVGMFLGLSPAKFAGFEDSMIEIWILTSIRNPLAGLLRSHLVRLDWYSVPNPTSLVQCRLHSSLCSWVVSWLCQASENSQNKNWLLPNFLSGPKGSRLRSIRPWTISGREWEKTVPVLPCQLRSYVLYVIFSWLWN